MHLPRRSCDEVGALLMMTSCCPQTRSRSRGNPRSLSLSPTLSPPTPSSSPSLSTSRSFFSILYIPPLLHCLSSLLDFINTQECFKLLYYLSQVHWCHDMCDVVCVKVCTLLTPHSTLQRGSPPLLPPSASRPRPGTGHWHRMWGIPRGHHTGPLINSALHKTLHMTIDELLDLKDEVF